MEELHLSQEVWDLIYPVGTIKKFTNNIDPNVLYGGTWQKLEGVFLFASDASHPLGSTGGKEFLELTANIGACNDNPGALGYNATSTCSDYCKSGNGALYVPNSGLQNFDHWNHGTTVTEHHSGSRYVDNKPPYKSVNVWERIA